MACSTGSPVRDSEKFNESAKKTILLRSCNAILLPPKGLIFSSLFCIWSSLAFVPFVQPIRPLLLQFSNIVNIAKYLSASLQNWSLVQPIKPWRLLREGVKKGPFS